MKEIDSFIEKVESILESQPDYKFEVYTFVMAALHHTVSKLKKPRHVSGPELLEGIRQYALSQYGGMARTVLGYWGVDETRDFGRIVFALVEAGILRKQPEDKIEDFDKVYDFKDAFEERFCVDEEESDSGESESGPA